jgi:hypothetical protein
LLRHGRGQVAQISLPCSPAAARVDWGLAKPWALTCGSCRTASSEEAALRGWVGSPVLLNGAPEARNRLTVDQQSASRFTRHTKNANDL